MNMPFNGFSEPGGGDSDSAEFAKEHAIEAAKPKNLVNHLLLIWAIEHIKHSPTQFTEEGKESPVIIVDVVDLCHNPEPYRAQWWRPLYLVGALKGNVGKPPTLVVMKLDGRSFQLESMSAHPQAVDIARQWFMRNQGFTPSVPAPPPQAQGNSFQDPWATVTPTRPNPAAQSRPPAGQQPPNQAPAQGWNSNPQPQVQGWGSSTPSPASGPPAQEPLTQQSILDRLRQQVPAQQSSPPGNAPLWGAEAPPLPPPDQGEAPF